MGALGLLMMGTGILILVWVYRNPEAEAAQSAVQTFPSGARALGGSW